ncbi:MAG: DUF5107 domain-containing protein [Hydrogenoanaerobacterium sp.]
MKPYSSTLRLPAALPKALNPLPPFRARSHNKNLIDAGLLPQELTGFGDETGFCALPYTMQDNYNRELTEQELATVVLENDCLKATFLADYGGRLWSLYDKKAGRELLFKNPVFRTANLAIRNAWFCGGIEWNLGQYGHSCLTCEPMFFAACTDDCGNPFLRMYEYERQKCLFLQIDFHLPQGASYLAAHVQIMNSKTEAVPLYWWTNIAVPENRNVRVLSGTKEVIYICPETQKTEGAVHGFAHGEMPYLKTLGGLDASYPKNLPYSNEYFFQNPASLKNTWEAAFYDDGTAFWERSTQQLRYRKMFCWGNHTGGKHWKRFLSDDENGDYIEIQAGLAPTQVHGATIGGGKVVSFTQVFGGCTMDKKTASGEWETACDYAYDELNKRLSSEELQRIDAAFLALSIVRPDEILHEGSGWGALEALRDENIIPMGMMFPKNTIGVLQQPWTELLRTGAFPAIGENEQPTSWLTDKRWLGILEKSLESKANQNATAYLHYGVMLIENDCWKEAVVALQHSLNILPSAIAHRCMAQALEELGRGKEACEQIEAAVKLSGENAKSFFSEEYILLHSAEGQWEKAWEFYENLPPQLKQGERIRLNIAESAFELGKTEFLDELFTESFATMREGESALLELWYKRQAQLLALQNACDDYRMYIDTAKAECIPPYNLDFRQTP